MGETETSLVDTIEVCKVWCLATVLFFAEDWEWGYAITLNTFRTYAFLLKVPLIRGI